ncbi:hypothetical protein C1J01_10850 [Nonomuraea aridisoli]|uniref:Uncharacterized protein n=1 Tax=Nonomuraea aridisoli TaxID=2070368 RepID=A0A2W2F2A5_9ACTN|nr:hypothetical protein C1J01_10850 [Nonomuraea aridisoli]
MLFLGIHLRWPILVCAGRVAFAAVRLDLDQDQKVVDQSCTPVVHGPEREAQPSQGGEEYQTPQMRHGARASIQTLAAMISRRWTGWA